MMQLQRSKLEGRNLLERCDKLLHSIAEITASELHPSPVSVLDSSFYKDESSPSPVMKRSIDFRGRTLPYLPPFFRFIFSSIIITHLEFASPR